MFGFRQLCWITILGLLICKIFFVALILHICILSTTFLHRKVYLEKKLRRKKQKTLLFSYWIILQNHTDKLGLFGINTFPFTKLQKCIMDGTTVSQMGHIYRKSSSICFIVLKYFTYFPRKGYK